MRRRYHVVERGSKRAAEKMEAFCQANGQVLLPLVEMVEQARLAVDEVLEQASRSVVQTILRLSAEQVAGPKTPGKTHGDVRWHGRQGGRIRLADRQLAVERPRLRRKGRGAGQEVPIPAYEALQHSEETGARIFSTLLRGVSTRNYQDVIAPLAETVGVSKSAISREAIEAGTQQLAALLARRWESVELLVIYLDGMQFGEHHVIGAVGVDVEGRKHVLGIQLGATENAAAVKDLLTHLREQGVDTARRYLFVIDGSKALRAGLREVFGAEQPVQRCRTHKIRNVLEHLPAEELRQQSQIRSMLRAAWRCPTAKEGLARMTQIAAMLETRWPEAAASLREGLEETFTVNRLDVPVSLHRCLVTTNLIESPHSGVRKKTGNVCRWRSGEMILRWVAGAWLLTEKSFRKIIGHQDLWTLARILGRNCDAAVRKGNVA